MYNHSFPLSHTKIPPLATGWNWSHIEQLHQLHFLQRSVAIFLHEHLPLNPVYGTVCLNLTQVTPFLYSYKSQFIFAANLNPSLTITWTTFNLPSLSGFVPESEALLLSDSHSYLFFLHFTLIMAKSPLLQFRQPHYICAIESSSTETGPSTQPTFADQASNLPMYVSYFSKSISIHVPVQMS